MTCLMGAKVFPAGGGGTPWPRSVGESGRASQRHWRAPDQAIRDLCHCAWYRTSEERRHAIIEIKLRDFSQFVSRVPSAP